MLPEDHFSEPESAFDLEDGEITEEEARSEESKYPGTTAIESAGQTTSIHIVPRTSPRAMHTQPLSEEAVSATIEAVESQVACTPSQVEKVEVKLLSIPSTVAAGEQPEHDLKTPRALSLEELEIAKNIVLDLLGWGVQPEYLVECGVSSHAIYRIFTDLHLRLPSNLSYLVNIDTITQAATMLQTPRFAITNTLNQRFSSLDAIRNSQNDNNQNAGNRKQPTTSSRHCNAVTYTGDRGRSVVSYQSNQSHTTTPRENPPAPSNSHPLGRTPLRRTGGFRRLPPSSALEGLGYNVSPPRTSVAPHASESHPIRKPIEDRDERNSTHERIPYTAHPRTSVAPQSSPTLSRPAPSCVLMNAATELAANLSFGPEAAVVCRAQEAKRSRRARFDKNPVQSTLVYSSTLKVNNLAGSSNAGSSRSLATSANPAGRSNGNVISSLSLNDAPSSDPRLCSNGAVPWVLPDDWRTRTLLIIESLISAEAFLGILQQCPHLQELHVNIYRRDTDTRLSRGRTVRAAHLNILAIRTSIEPRPILDALSLPKLKVFCLEWDGCHGQSSPRHSRSGLYDLVEESSCPLTYVSLRDIFPSESELSTPLTGNSTLQELIALWPESKLSISQANAIAAHPGSSCSSSIASSEESALSTCTWVVPDEWKLTTELTVKNSISAEVFLKIVSECNLLQRLSVTIHHRDSNRPTLTQGRTIRSNALEILSITTSVEPRPLLDALNLPNLSHFHLGWDSCHGQSSPRHSQSGLYRLLKESSCSLKSLSLLNIFSAESELLDCLKDAHLRADLEELAVLGDDSYSIPSRSTGRLVTGKTLRMLASSRAYPNLKTLDLSNIVADDGQLSSMVRSRAPTLEKPLHLVFSFQGNSRHHRNDLKTIRRLNGNGFSFRMKGAELIAMDWPN
ncbi:hypothetical protein DXG03_008316 [Asterophora parasitica]|uniref:Uncharacterized protein n=1 Tax=Asterophora parasitica TaxID=117018 RepID=A0A9P7KCT0_9AGAR|nr:hypothetical protein DXG03_008316 [Asterophora parasitica]